DYYCQYYDSTLTTLFF
nr:immunoglobulin light chain junction region [Macaca mulatta]MOX28390.1 immunoglobulin light chain junction region [Macaca mulatta]MOX28392.1 immunoglobulin light chain junction region [Macaca mulatta]MOX28444.1 immunoglobulin light chain junction region [Macaca mulatta]MOX28553.1 immunoglobulin light chain junction region [Macaca mulatta]